MNTEVRNDILLGASVIGIKVVAVRPLQDTDEPLFNAVRNTLNALRAKLSMPHNYERLQARICVANPIDGKALLTFMWEGLMFSDLKYHSRSSGLYVFTRDVFIEKLFGGLASLETVVRQDLLIFFHWKETLFQKYQAQLKDS